jgi:hypothetical protein
VELQEDVLRNFFGRLAVAQEMHRQAEDHGLPLPHDLREIARAGCDSVVRVRQVCRLSHRQELCLLSIKRRKGRRRMQNVTGLKLDAPFTP